MNTTAATSTAETSTSAVPSTSQVTRLRFTIFRPASTMHRKLAQRSCATVKKLRSVRVTCGQAGIKRCVSGIGARGFIAWILLGLLAGTFARALVPGRTEPGGCIGTTAIGIVGALLGGLIASALDLGEIKHFFDLETWLIAIAGSVLLLLAVRLIAGPRRS